MVVVAADFATWQRDWLCAVADSSGQAGLYDLPSVVFASYLCSEVGLVPLYPSAAAVAAYHRSYL